MIATMILYADFFGFGGASARINDEDYEDLNVDDSTGVKSKADKGEDEECSRLDEKISLCDTLMTESVANCGRTFSYSWFDWVGWEHERVKLGINKLLMTFEKLDCSVDNCNSWFFHS